MGDDETAAAPTMAAVPEPHAYEFEIVEPEPEVSGRGWVVPTVALTVALSGVAAAGLVGWYTFKTPGVEGAPGVHVTPTVEYRHPALLHPDQDTAFLQELDGTGTIYDTAGTAIHNARLVCKMLEAGKSEDDIAAGFAQAMEIAADKSGVFVTLSVKHYCPTTPPV